jgi:hypothetical protein
VNYRLIPHYNGKEFEQSAGQTLIRQEIEGHKPDVLVLDQGQSLTVGVDENSAEEVSPAQHFIDELIQDYELTVFLVMRGTTLGGSPRAVHTRIS